MDPVAVAGSRAPKARNAAEEEYLAKLQAIRRQNYLEKKRIMEKVSASKDAGASPPPPAPRDHPPPPQVGRRREEDELEARRKKIAALKVSAGFGVMPQNNRIVFCVCVCRLRQISRQST